MELSRRIIRSYRDEGAPNAMTTYPAQSSSALYQWLSSSVQKMKISEGAPVVKWLQDLRLTTESECMSILQGKSVAKESLSIDGRVLHTKKLKDGIDSIRNRAQVANNELSKLLRKVEKGRWKHMKSSGLWLTHHLRNLLHEINSQIPDPPMRVYTEEQSILAECSGLVQSTESIQDGVMSGAAKKSLLDLLTKLGQSVSALVDTVLGVQVEALLDTLDSRISSTHCLTSSVGHIINLGLEGEYMCYIIAREGGVQRLFELCRSDILEVLRAQCLRAIATLCCVSKSILELEEANGVEVLSDILSAERYNEMVRSEAAGVVAQITSPTLDHYQHINGFIENMEDLIRSLTALCLNASSHEVFLLGAAAIANITFMDPLSSDYLLQYHTMMVLAQCSTLQKAESLFAKDQIVTVLANMAQSTSCFDEIVSNDCLSLLLTFLNIRPTPKLTEAELAACERVHQKSAIALTRLAKDPNNARIVVAQGGEHRLVQLCKDSAARNGSDVVLVAALAALRKLVSTCGNSNLSSLDMKQLVQPKIMDSYLMCSKHSESFV
ncbi:protein inscuteable homolog isoform X2 [Watersipora subatra]|uniref:protein inscuteable homolog isoform X2 n=1 Tax=Watersipora subatra TaxID=2589382 RepID=UPI00355B6706